MSSDRVPETRDRRFIPLCLAFLILGAVSFYASFVHARAQADAVIARIPQPWVYYSSRFCPLASSTGRWGPSWEFSYEPRNYFPVGPGTLNVTLTGEVIGSNPSDFLPKIKALP